MIVPVSDLASTDTKFPTASIAPAMVSALTIVRSGTERIRSMRFCLSTGATVIWVRVPLDTILMSVSETPFGDMAFRLGGVLTTSASALTAIRPYLLIISIVPPLEIVSPREKSCASAVNQVVETANNINAIRFAVRLMCWDGSIFARIGSGAAGRAPAISFLDARRPQIVRSNRSSIRRRRDGFSNRATPL